MFRKKKSLTGIASGLQLYKTIKDISAPDIDYDVLQLTAEQRDIEAESVLAEVEQEANFIREQFLESVGTHKAMKAARGVKVTEGDLAEGLERSAIAVSEDIQTIKESARFKAKQLRAKGAQYRAGAKDQKSISYWERVGKGVGGISKMIKTLK